jgi:Ricin-type beta-trefoil lectin domain
MFDLKRIAVACTGFLSIGAVMAGASMPAAAGTKTYVNVSTGFCLDSNAENKVYAIGCNGGNYQNWTRVGRRLVNVSTGFCLDSNAGGKVYAIGCNGGNYQNWMKQGNRLVNVSTGFCLDGNASNEVYTLGCNGGNYQNWQ